LGLCGEPLAACHLGGVIGGIVAFFLYYGFEKLNLSKKALIHKT